MDHSNFLNCKVISDIYQGGGEPQEINVINQWLQQSWQSCYKVNHDILFFQFCWLTRSLPLHSPDFLLPLVCMSVFWWWIYIFFAMLEWRDSDICWPVMCIHFTFWYYAIEQLPQILVVAVEKWMNRSIIFKKKDLSRSHKVYLNVTTLI